MEVAHDAGNTVNFSKAQEQRGLYALPAGILTLTVFKLKSFKSQPSLLQCNH